VAIREGARGEKEATRALFVIGVYLLLSAFAFTIWRTWPRFSGGDTCRSGRMPSGWS
jgi:hypothetical protein